MFTQKQLIKDEKKKDRKRKRVENNSSVRGRKFIIPNIKEIPENCKHLMKGNDVSYVVPGDGCCGPNCAAAFLFQDEIFGPKLRRRMNLFFSKHWYRRYQYISQFSEDHPFKRKLTDGEINYTDPEKLIKYLTHSSEADYMWSDGEDFHVISDMFQITIKVITTKGPNDQSPSVNWINPDMNLKDFAELSVKMNDMVLLHENDTHFNLILT